MHDFGGCHVRLLFSATAIGSISKLAGCASSTGILPAGPDTYTITTRKIVGIGDGAQKAALQEASEFCENKGRVFVPSTMAKPGDVSYDVTFRCLLPNDPAVGAYRLQGRGDRLPITAIILTM